MNDEDLGLVRRISREQAKKWGIPYRHTMNPQPVCETCSGPVDWIDSPSGAWWAHWNHPEDGHDAMVDIEPDGRAFFIAAEHIESKRFQEEWSLVFFDPDLQDAWEVAYFEPNGAGESEVDEWNDAREVVLTRVRRVEVVRYEWHSVKSLVNGSTPRP